MLSHYLDSDSDCSDNEEGIDSVKEKLHKLSDLNKGDAERIAKITPLKSIDFSAKDTLSAVDFILSFVSHKVLSCKQVRLSYNLIKSPLEFAKSIILKTDTKDTTSIDALIAKQHEINDDLKNCFLFMPVVSDKLQNKYDKFLESRIGKSWSNERKFDSIEDIVHRVKILASLPSLEESDTDFIKQIRPLIKYLEPRFGKDSYITEAYKASEEEGKKGEKVDDTLSLLFSSDIKKYFVKDRECNFPGDMIRFSPNKQESLDAEFTIKAIKDCDFLKSACEKYQRHKQAIQQIQTDVQKYHDQYDYGQGVKKADFLPQVLYYARAIKNLIKQDKILSKADCNKIDRWLPNTPKCVPVMVEIYHTLSINLLVHNVGSYANIAKEYTFDDYMRYFLNPNPTESKFEKEAALYVLMQIEVIRNPSALFTNAMFLLLVKAQFKSLRHVDEQDSNYSWNNIEQQLPVAMKNAVREGLYIEYKLFSNRLISGKPPFKDIFALLYNLDDNKFHVTLPKWL